MTYEEIKPMAIELANLMFNDQATIPVKGWDNLEVTFFYLPTEHHLLHGSSRGFGMKKSIKHFKGDIVTFDNLVDIIIKDWGL